MPLKSMIKFAGLCMLTWLVSCSPDNNPRVASAAEQPIALEVYKSPTCGCCGMWVDHASARGFEFTVQHLDNEELTLEKLRRGIGLRYHSCHTAVAEDGSVFEGHVPAYLIHQFLADKPENAIGLAVPGMPIGSPGMEVGDRFQPYDVYQLNADGTAEVYTHVGDFESQYQTASVE